MNKQPSLETSLEAGFEETEEFESYEEHIAMLKENNRLTGLALRKAEQLIEEYSRENLELRISNCILATQIDELKEQLGKLQKGLREDKKKMAEDSFLKEDEEDKTHKLIENRINQLNNRHEQVQLRIGGLTAELEKSESKIVHFAKLKQIKAEESMHHYFSFATPKNRKKDEHQEIRSLKWRLEHRDEEISFLLRRNKQLEERIPENFSNKQERRDMDKMKKSNQYYRTCETDE